MYHFTNHDLYHPNPYHQQCQIYVEQQSKSAPVAVPNTQYNSHFEAVIPHNVVPSQTEAPTTTSSTQNLTDINENKRKSAKNKSKVVDTSNFSIEERLVAAVWVHERKHTKNSMFQIKQNFRQRFGREPPAKNTLLVWEKKLFSSGSVHDAPRPGRPVNRLQRVQEVSASVRVSPALSLRARARALRLPRTTLRTILRHDLRTNTNTVLPTQTIDKNLGVKRQLSKKRGSKIEQSGVGAAAASHVTQRDPYT